MPSSVKPRPNSSLPANETALLSPTHSRKSPFKAFSRIISPLNFKHDASNLKSQVPKPSSARSISDQGCTPRLNTPSVSVKGMPKTNSTIMSHFTLPPSNPTPSKPTPRISFIDPSPTASRTITRPRKSKQPPPKAPVIMEYTMQQPTAQTRYVDMLLGLDEIPRSHNLFASFSTWILLAGFIVIPGTFEGVADSKMLQEGAKHNQVEHAVLNTVKHASLMGVATCCCVIGSAGMVWLWWRWRKNYVWLINKIFLVGLLNSTAGLISTLINVYSQHGGNFSITAKVTVVATASCTCITTLLYLLYNFWALQGVRNRHQKELELESGKRNTRVVTWYKMPDDEARG